MFTNPSNPSAFNRATSKSRAAASRNVAGFWKLTYASIVRIGPRLGERILPNPKAVSRSGEKKIPSTTLASPPKLAPRSGRS